MALIINSAKKNYKYVVTYAFSSCSDDLASDCASNTRLRTNEKLVMYANELKFVEPASDCGFKIPVTTLPDIPNDGMSYPVFIDIDRLVYVTVASNPDYTPSAESNKIGSHTIVDKPGKVEPIGPIKPIDPITEEK